MVASGLSTSLITMDKIKITILEDGTIKVDSDRVSMPNHMNAEQFLRNMFTLAGGTITRTFKRGLAHLQAHGQEQVQ